MEDVIPFRQDPDETRRQLLAAAAAEFLEKGYAGASFASIATRLGITKGAFSYHFPTKASLAEAVFARFVEALEGADQRAHEVFPDGGLRALAAFMVEAGVRVLDDPASAAAVSLFLDVTAASISVPEKMDAWAAGFETYLHEAQELGEVDLLVEAATAAEFLLVSQTGVYAYLRRYPDRQRAEPLVNLQLGLRAIGVQDPARIVAEAIEALDVGGDNLPRRFDAAKS